MTAILAIDYYYQIIVIADCRVSWSTKPPKLQDNLQKVYPFGPTGIFGFAGGIAAAKAVVKRINQETPAKTLPPSARVIVDDITIWAKDAYSHLAQSDQQPLELMYVAIDYAQSSSRTPMTNNILAKFVSPNFAPEIHSNFLPLGYAINYSADTIIINRNNMLSLGFEPSGLEFQLGISIGAFGEGLAKLAGDPVGGMFSMGVITAQGVHWRSYSYDNGYELKIENGTFVQYDLKNQRRVPLKAIWDFDARRPDAGNIVFHTLSSL